MRRLGAGRGAAGWGRSGSERLDEGEVTASRAEPRTAPSEGQTR